MTPWAVRATRGTYRPNTSEASAINVLSTTCPCSGECAYGNVDDSLSIEWIPHSSNRTETASIGSGFALRP